MRKHSGIKLTSSMIIFGTVGIFVVNIPLPSAVIAMIRGAVGAVFLLLAALLLRRPPDMKAIRRDFAPLAISGMFIGFNWALLFESYKYTSVAVSTLVYYLAPAIVMLLSVFLLGERLTLGRGIAISVALVGMLLVSGVLESGIGQTRELFGVLLALGAAVLYAFVTVINKRWIKYSSDTDKTQVQLIFASLAIAPFAIWGAWGRDIALSVGEILLLVTLGVVHTGLAYLLYFGSVKGLKGQTVAILSYIDPIVAVLLSFIIEGSFDITVLIGCALIVGSMLVAELMPGAGKE